MARNNNLSDFLSDIASAIRTKKGTSGDIAAQSFPEEILSIESGGSAINNINCVKYIDSYIDISEGYDFHGDGTNPVTLPVNRDNRFSFPWINGQQYKISIVEAQTSGGGMVTVYAYNSSTNTRSDALVSAGYDAPNRSVEWTCNGVYDMITIYNGTGGGSACNWQHIKVEINVEGYYAVETAQSTIPQNIANGYAKVKSGSATTPTSSITATPSGPTWNSTTSKYDITFSGSKSITPTVSAGWVSAGTAGTVSASGTKSLDKSISAVTGSVNVSATTTVAPGTVSINETTAAVSGKTQVNATPTTSTDGIGKYYLAVKATAAANSTGTTSNITGSGTAKSVTTAGYEPGSGSNGYTKAITISGTATAKTSAKESSQYYIPLPSGTATASVTISTSGSGNVNPGTNTISKNTNTNVSTGTTTTTKPSTGYYVAVDASTASGSGTVSVSGSSSNTIVGVTAGWIPGGYTGNLGTFTAYAAGSASVTVPVKAASTTYIPITSGSATGVAGSLSGTTFTQDTTNKKKFNITTTVSAPAPSVGTGYIVSGAGSAGSSVNRTTSITITDAQAIEALGADQTIYWQSSAPANKTSINSISQTGYEDVYLYNDSGFYLPANKCIKLLRPSQGTAWESTSAYGTVKLSIKPKTGVNNYAGLWGFFNTGCVEIPKDDNFIAANIKSGVSIYGVTGTYTGSGGSSSSIVQITQAAYNALTTKDPNTIYLIIG